MSLYTRFPSSPLIIRVPFFLLFGFNKGTQKEKGQKGTTGEPSICILSIHRCSLICFCARLCGITRGPMPRPCDRSSCLWNKALES